MRAKHILRFNNSRIYVKDLVSKIYLRSGSLAAVLSKLVILLLLIHCLLLLPLCVGFLCWVLVLLCVLWSFLV